MQILAFTFQPVNLSTIVLCEPDGGKSPAFDIACSKPIQFYMEENRNTKIILDDFTDAGMFQQIRKSLGHKKRRRSHLSKEYVFFGQTRK